MLDAEWSTLLVGYPKWKVDADSGKFPIAKMLRLSIEPVGLKKIHKVSLALDADLHKINIFAPNEYRGVVNSSGLVVYKGSTQEIKRY